MPPQAQTSHRWWESFGGSLEHLANHRACLVAVLLAWNALVLPYRGLYHDAKLYAVQVLNRVENGTYQDDLFFQHGSQDNYSIFSFVLAPAVQVAGVEWAFFAFYVVFKAFLIFGALRFFEALTDNRVTSTLAAMFFAVAPMSFGAFGIFSVNEQFLTPRLVACGFALLGLSFLVQDRLTLAFLLHGLALLIHPIMALGSSSICVVWLASDKLPRRWFVAFSIVVGVAIAVVLNVAPVGYALFGRVDPQWHNAVRAITPSTFPLEWNVANWMVALVSFVVVLVAAVAIRHSQPQAARLLGIACVVVATALVCNTVASERGYRLLSQAQPYRSLWLLSTLQVPAAFLAMAGWWRRAPSVGWVFGLALALSGEVLLAPTTILLHTLFAAGPLAFVLISTKRNSIAAALIQSAGLGLLIGVVINRLFHIGIVIAYRDYFLGRDGALWFVLETLARFGPILWLGIALLGVRWLHQRKRFSSLLAGQIVILVVLSQVGLVVSQANPWTANWLPEDTEDHEFATTYIASRAATKSRLTIYWPKVPVDVLWRAGKANCYFAHHQIAGSIYSRGTAIEGIARAKIVGPFEVAYRQRHAPSGPKQFDPKWQKLFGVHPQDGPPTIQDLANVCAQPVDYIVLEEKFEGLYSATNGRVYIYERNHVLASLDSSHSKTTRSVLRAARNQTKNSPPQTLISGVPNRD